MPKCYHPRLIDLEPPKKTARVTPGTLSVQDEDGDPDVSNVKRMRFPNGTVTKNADGDVSIAGGGGAFKGAAVFLGGSLTDGSIGPALTNLTGGSLAYNRVKVTCAPVAPDGGLAISLAVGSSTYTFAIAVGTSSDGPDTVTGSWADNDDAILTLTDAGTLGTYSGSICAMFEQNG